MTAVIRVIYQNLKIKERNMKCLPNSHHTIHSLTTLLFILPVLNTDNSQTPISPRATPTYPGPVQMLHGEFIFGILPPIRAPALRNLQLALKQCTREFVARERRSLQLCGSLMGLN